MKTAATAASTAAAQQRRRPAAESPPRPRRGHQAAQPRAQQKNGAYKRVELFLGLEAAIALRHLMRDGRSAREVIEALLRDEKQRRQERG